MPLDYDVAEEATSDLRSMWEHYAKRASLRVADQVLHRTIATIAGTIARRPRAGRMRPEFGERVYSFPIVPFVIFYEVSGRRVRILRVLHGHRDIHQPLMSLLAAV